MKNIWFNKNNNKKLQEENNNNKSSVNCKPRLGSIQNKTKTTKREKFATKKEHNFCFAESRQLKKRKNETKWNNYFEMRRPQQFNSLFWQENGL